MMQPARQTRAMPAMRQRPAELRRGGGEEAEALGVAGDLAGEERLLQPVDELRLGGKRARGEVEAVGAGRAFVEAGGDVAGGDRGLDGGGGRAEVLRLDRRPAAGALLAGAVEDDVDDRQAGVGVDGAGDLAGDLDRGRTCSGPRFQASKAGATSSASKARPSRMMP